MLITVDVDIPPGGEATGALQNISTMEELTEIMLNDCYSLSTFKENHLKKNNFINAKSIALDFDKEFTLKDAQKTFKEYKHVIATTKSHQKEKNGIVCDRFRVVLFLSEVIDSNEVFYATYNKLQKDFPKLDGQCKNSNRWFYPSKEIISINKKGNLLEPVKNVEPVHNVSQDLILQTKGKGKLSKKTVKMLKDGIESGSRNGETFKIAKDFQENGYTEDEAVQFIIKAMTENDTMSYDFTSDEVENTVRSAYTSDPTNAPRKPFKLMPVGELYQTAPTIKWIVDNLLSEGGVSLLSASPKVGKSQIARQLITCMAKGDKFLGRETTKGEIHYYAIEEQAAVINESFKKMGLPSSAQVYVHVGDIYSETPLKEFYEILKERKPVLAVVDTLFDILDVESENNYKEVKKELRSLRNIARMTGTHIVCVHHANKSFGGITGGHKNVLGSQAIVGGVDTIMVIEMSSDMRVITTMGRSIKRWVTRELIWDDKTGIYSLGKKVEADEF